MTRGLFVFLGGGIGCVLRYCAGLVITSTMFPYATFAVNAVGSVAIGIAAVALGYWIAKH